MESKVLPVMMLVGLIATAIQSPAFADTTIEYDCSGSLSIMDESAQIAVKGDCGEIFLSGNDNVITFESVRNLKIAGDGNTITQRNVANGAATELWIGGDKNTAVLNGTSKITLAGDGNNVSYQNGNKVEPILLGDNNEVSVNTDLIAVPASTQAQSESSSSNMSEAEREALEELVYESASGGTSNDMSDEELREAAEEAMNKFASEASSGMSEEALREAAEEALNESGG